VKWEPGVKMWILESREEAVEARSMRHEVQVYADGSGMGGGIGAAVVLFRNREEKHMLRNYLVKEGKHIVFEVEVMGLQGRDTHGQQRSGPTARHPCGKPGIRGGHQDNTCWTSTKRGWRWHSAGMEQTPSRSGGPQGMMALPVMKKKTLRQKRLLTETQAQPVNSPSHVDAWSQSADQLSSSRTSRGLETRQPASL